MAISRFLVRDRGSRIPEGASGQTPPLTTWVRGHSEILAKNSESVQRGDFRKKLSTGVF